VTTRCYGFDPVDRAIYAPSVGDAADLGLSTRVFDTTTGMPATDMLVECHRLEPSGWTLLAAARTDAKGRVESLLSGATLTTGDYRMHYMTGAWYARRRVDCFFPSVTLDIRISDAAHHHHVSLLLSPFAYSAHRDS